MTDDKLERIAQEWAEIWIDRLEARVKRLERLENAARSLSSACNHATTRLSPSGRVALDKLRAALEDDND